MAVARRPCKLSLENSNGLCGNGRRGGPGGICVSEGAVRDRPSITTDEEGIGISCLRIAITLAAYRRHTPVSQWDARAPVETCETRSVRSAICFPPTRQPQGLQ